MLPAALGTALAVVLAVLLALAVRHRRQRRALEDAQRQLARVQGLLQEGAARLGRVAAGVPTPVDGAELPDPLRDVLHLVGDFIGARYVAYWQRRPDGSLVPVISSDGTPVMEGADVAALAAWADDEGLSAVRDHASGAAVAVAPVPDHRGAPTRGALVARASPEGGGGFAGTRDAIRRGLEAGGAVVARIALLQASQRAASHEGDVTRALLGASREFTEVRSAEALTGRLCETALAVSGGTRAALVRWDPLRATGQVVAATRSHSVVVGQAVTLLSAVGEGCAEGHVVSWNGEPPPDDQPVFAPGEPTRPQRSGAVLPLTRGRAVLGALVVEAEAAGALREVAVRNLTLLAAISVPPLEAVWDYEEVERRARTDALTGLWNRRHFEAELGRWFEQVDRYGGSLALVMCDVDRFKQVNDTHGHESGDAVLRHLAALLGEGARSVDVVARLGGEEFAVLLPTTTTEAAAAVAERLRISLERRPAPLPGGRQLQVTASFGVAAYPSPVSSAGALVGAADAALYAAKRGGRNRVEVSLG